MKKKVQKFKIDEWVLYCAFPDSNADFLRKERIRAVILQTLSNRDLYDYEIFLDDGTSKIIKVKEEKLFKIEK
jgi:hypothetical protein